MPSTFLAAAHRNHGDLKRIFRHFLTDLIRSQESQAISLKYFLVGLQRVHSAVSPLRSCDDWRLHVSSARKAHAFRIMSNELHWIALITPGGFFDAVSGMNAPAERMEVPATRHNRRRSRRANGRCCRPCARQKPTRWSSPMAPRAGTKSVMAPAARHCMSRACWR
jgi:hypothetical protein